MDDLCQAYPLRVFAPVSLEVQDNPARLSPPFSLNVIILVGDRLNPLKPPLGCQAMTLLYFDSPTPPTVAAPAQAAPGRV